MTFSSAQNLDSLWAVWSDSTLVDTVRLYALDKYVSKVYLEIEYDSAYSLAQMQFEFAEKQKLKLHMAKALCFQGILLRNKQKYPQSLERFFRELKIYEDKKDDQMKVNCLTNIARCYVGENEYLKGIGVRRCAGAKNLQLSMRCCDV